MSSGREYVSLVTIHGTNIYSVASEPSFVAPQGSLAIRTDDAQLWQNTDGATTWSQMGGDLSSLLLLIPISGSGLVVAPVVDPAGLRNLCYIPESTVDEIEMELPQITPTLPALWRATLGGGYSPAPLLYVYPNPADGFANVGASFLTVEGFEVGTSASSVTLIHDGVDTWSVFVAGAGIVGWTTAPVLSGEVWPGGFVDSDGGAYVSEGSVPTYDWTIDLVSTGITDALEFEVQMSDFEGDLVQIGDLRGQLSPSNTLTLVQVSGFTRAATVDFWASRANTSPNAAGCTLLIEFIGFADGLVASWGRGSTPGSRREFSLLVSGGQVVGGLRVGAVTTTYAYTAAGLTDGVTRHIVGFDFTTTGSLARLAYILPGVAPVYVTTPTTGAWQNPFSATSGGRVQFFRRAAELVTSGLPASEWIGVVEGAFMSSRLDTSDYDAISADGSLTAWGLWSRGDAQSAFHPSPGNVIDGTLVGAAFEIQQASWSVVATAGDEFSAGGLNVPV